MNAAAEVSRMETFVHPISTSTISTTDLVKRFEHEEVLRSINLEVPTGSVYLLAGTNGAGKSTLLRILLNLDQPTSGSAMVSGLNPQRRGPAVRASTGYVSEEVEPGYRWMRVGQLLLHRARLFPTWDASYADQLVGALEIRMDKVIGKLSKGEARRVQLVAALAFRPKLLMLDEPTDGFDPLIRDRVLELLSAHLADTHCTALISTHLAGEVDQLTDWVGILHRGQLISQGAREDLLASVRRYELETPDNWLLPGEIQACPHKLERGLGRRCMLVVRGGDTANKTSLVQSGATIRAETGVSLEEAILLILKKGGRT